MKSDNQEVAETAVKRTVYDKYGKYKYVVKLCNKILEELKALRVTQQYMVRGLEHEFLFEPKYVEASLNFSTLKFLYLIFSSLFSLEEI